MLYIDCTDTITRRYGTGIQRVVRKIVGELLIADISSVTPVMAIDNNFYPLNTHGREALMRPNSQHAKASSGITQRLAKRVLELSIRLYLHVQERSFDKQARAALRQFADGTPCIMRAEDSVLLLDSFWGGTSSLKAALKASHQGAAIIGYIHDLIPLTHPHVMPRWQPLATRRAVKKIATFATGIITTSEHCSSTVKAFLGSKYQVLLIKHNYHGNDFAIVSSESKFGTSLMKRLQAEERKTYVMVGTIEPRKGHDTVLSAFEKMWNEGSTDALIFVGRIGWAEAAFIKRMRTHPEQGRRFILLDEANDADLAAVLRGSSAAIVASIVEGFGLPIVEALAEGLPLIASDIPVFREIAGSNALFFDVGDSDDLIRAVRTTKAGFGQEAKSFAWPTWRQSAFNLIEIIAEMRAKNTAIGNYINE